MNVPKLRFKDFSGEYKNITFDKLANYKKGPFGSSLKKDMFVPKDANSIKVYEQQNAIKKDWTLERYFITKEYYEKLKGFTVKPGDIIVSCAGTIGEYYVLPYNAEIGVINQALMRISTNNLINQNYFLYIFDNMVFHFSKTFSNGSAIKNIPPFSDLKKQIAYIPSIEEQNKVAQFLSLLDKKIELQTKKIEALKLFKKGLLNEFLKRNPCSKISLKYILKERKKYTIKDGILPHVTLSKNGIEEKIERYNRDFLVKSKDKNYKITKIYDLCYNPANLKFGVICLNTYGSAIFSPIYITFEINHKFNPLYIGYYVTQQNFINSARKYEQGTVYERMAVAPEDFLKMNIWVPNKHIQDKFSTILISMDTKLKKENEKLKMLEALKKGFMQSMFV